jgi:hypothetical protein
MAAKESIVPASVLNMAATGRSGADAPLRTMPTPPATRLPASPEVLLEEAVHPTATKLAVRDMSDRWAGWRASPESSMERCMPALRLEVT